MKLHLILLTAATLTIQACTTTTAESLIPLSAGMPWSGAVKRLAYHEASALMNLTKGLSEDEVVSILGKPGGKEMKGSRARLLYPMLTSSGHKFDHEIVFNKGKLTSYGLAESWDRS